MLGLGTLGYLVWVLLWQYSLFASDVFNYHDLTVICDWFSNAIVHGRPFWLTDANRSHLTIHLTPSLILLTPAFLFAKTQFSLIAVAACTVCIGIFLSTRDQRLSLRDLGLPPLYTVILTVSFFVLFAGNRYTARILSSAHFEPTYVLTAALLLHAIRRGAKLWVSLLLLLLTLGVRQDVGLFAFCLLVSCLVAPRSWRQTPALQILALSVVCILYVGLTAMWVMPKLGYHDGTRFWHEWGDTWPQVFFNWLTSPVRLYTSIADSDFNNFNLEFLYLGLLSPLSWVLNQAPGILFYTADAFDKRFLLFYNTSFLLPGMMLTLAFAQLHVAGFVLRRTQPDTRLRHLGLSALSAVFVAAAIFACVQQPRSREESIVVTKLKRTDPFVSKPLRSILACKRVHSVSADFHNLVFAPFKLDRYLFPRASQADVVVIPRKSDRHMPFYVKPRELMDTLTNGGYSLVAKQSGYSIFVKDTARCTH